MAAIEIWDISRLSSLKRRLEFTTRVARAFFGLSSIVFGLLIVVSAFLLFAYFFLRRPGDDDGFVLDRDGIIVIGMWAGIVAIIASSSVLFLATRGRRWAAVLAIAMFGGVVLWEIVDFCLDARAGFELYDIPADLSGMQAARVDSAISNDIRLIGYRVANFLLSVLVFALVARLAQVHFPRRKALSRQELAYVFSNPPRFALIARNFRNWLRHPAKFGVLIHSTLSVIAYLLYLAAVTWATMTPLYQGGANADYKLLNGAVNAFHLESLWAFWLYGFLGVVLNLGLAWLLFVVARVFLALSNRALVRSADRVREVDTRAPILYLRSFRNDRLPVRGAREAGILSLFDPAKERLRLEELIVRRLDAIGPVVAIADPKVRIPPFGAARKMAGDQDWHQLVTAYMAEAAAVVVLMDFTENLKWEMERLVERGHIRNTWFLFPPVTDRAHYRQMVDIAAEVVFAGKANPFEQLPSGLDVCALVAHDEQTLIAASRTKTLADYDIVLQRLSELATRPAVGARDNGRIDRPA